jgi:glycosyltransferase involved in cell wall biosynthesis
MGAYLTGIVSELARSAEVEWSFFSNRPDLPFQLPAGVGDRPTYLFDCPGSRFELWEQAALPLQARWRGVKVLHCPHSSLPLWQPVPTVVTLHDTIPWDDDGRPASRYWDHLLPWAFARCAAMVTPSEHSRHDILAHWPQLAERLFVVPHGIDPVFLEIAPGPLTADLAGLGVCEPYLVYCGGLVERKRLDWTIAMFEALDDRAVQLVVCGVAAQHHGAVRDRLRPETRARVRLLPYVATGAMARLFQNAAAVLYPTLYEGFGFPAIEVQAVGTPVLFSPLSSLRELAGPGARLVEPDDWPGWIELCARLIGEHRAGRAPESAARRWARRLFSWATAARRHLEIYRAAVAGQAVSRGSAAS